MSTSDADFPALADHALAAATRAPSVHNTQPWRFVLRPPRIDLYLDRERVLAVADADAREARLSCGAALLNLRVALLARGRATVVDLLPDPAHPDLLATVRVAGDRAPTPELRDLASAIDRRATNRRPFADRPVPAPHRSALVRAADDEGATLVLLDAPPALETFAVLLRRADRLQGEDPAFQAELAGWTHRAAEDGVPATAGGPRPAGDSLLTLRQFHSESTVERPFERDPLVAVLATAGDTVRDQVRAGQAMQRVLLTATSAGLSVSFLSQPLEVPDTRAGLRELLGGRGHPQAALRIGFGHPTGRTPRRPVAAVTVNPHDE
ncbi:Acg family FMN-binding oxidoreductase [Actinophytocola xanthii]|uniref:Nitroreductase n=1 Tax=Actinophytocola xanthii TaxID=1912961 RepID=A0A1Q8C6J6_9PSEU|nr:nitroreductase family protein [Actinophytocola xanthii]OLF09977.1 nitroreductase [Actinophytocola xanthii]